MPTRIELLKQAGFSDSEIGDWATAERQRMQGAGFTDSEIDDEFGVTRPPKEVPAAFVERMKQGNWFHRIIGAAGEYAQDYFGDEPFGFSPENQEALRKLGIVGDLTVAAAGPVDAALRSVPAGIAGIGAGLGQAWEEGHDAAFGPGAEAKGKAARDFAQFAQIAAMLLGTKGPKAGAIRTPAPKVTNAPVIALPRAEDFRNAAASISGTQASFQTEQKLLRLWTDHGIPPTEVAQDALRDRTIAENIRSNSEKLPDAYVGTGEPRPAAGVEPNPPAQLAESAQAESATAPAASKAAPVEADDKSSASLNAAQMIAEGKRVPFRKPQLEPQRSFAEDYPTAPPTDDRGRLLTDIEGRPLVAKFIAGRRRFGKADEPLRSEEVKGAINESGIGLYDVKGDVNPITGEPITKALRGFYHEPDDPQAPGDIYLHTAPNASDRNIVTAHEFGHAIDQLAGRLSPTLTFKEEAELRFVYRDLRGWKKKNAPMLQPENYGYRDDHINEELVAEGFRAYLTNPNYFKTIAPNAAAKFRAAVNESPLLKKAIQFNSLGAIGLMGTGVRGQDRDDQ